MFAKNVIKSVGNCKLTVIPRFEAQEGRTEEKPPDNNMVELNCDLMETPN
jgi:hypothetical protein